MDVFTVNVSNIHCDECRKSIKASVARVLDINDGHDGSESNSVSIKVDDSEVVLIASKGIFTPLIQKKVLKVIESTGFVVQDYLIHDNEELVSQHIKYPTSNNGRFSQPFAKLLAAYTHRRRRKIHIENCSKCKQEKRAKSSIASGSSDAESQLTKVDTTNVLEYRAVFTISGMTCASCASAVSGAIRDVLAKSKGQLPPEGEEPNQRVSVDVVSNTAVAIIPNKQLANHIIAAIKDVGYSSKLVELLPLERELKYRVNAAIGGITCAACASSISNAVSELPFVVESAISVVSKSGVFILDNKDPSKINELRETVENCGFDFDLVDILQVNHATPKKKSRTVNLKISGMFCQHCPEVISEILNSHGNAIVIDDPITLNKPFVKFTYIPSPPTFTIRSVLQEIVQIGNFEVEIIEEIGLDEHLRRIAKLETLKVAYRLVLTTILAIPTFIFGVVGMSLLPKTSSFRMWLDKPLWTGNTSRMTWILFFLATPVYFFAADIFHVKSLKEIRSLWKRKVSWKRRLFRFGSMNLLMSSGTSVAYFASIALLILSACTKAQSHGFTTTYFDSVVFLTFFLLIGRLLESFSKSKTAEAITELGNLKSNFATLLEKLDDDEYGNDTKTNIKLLEIGDYIRIAPGESPPVDSIIVKGTSEFDESALTGESTPVMHTVGEQTFAGTINKGPYSVVAKLSALDGTSLIDHIVNTVRDGQMRRAPIERLADVLTGYFVPVITALAIMTWLIWLGLGYGGALPDSYLDIDVGGWAVWSLEFAIAVFVVACPCGIGLAAPTALFVGAGLAANNGILARGGGSAFQEGSKVNVVCFDKTGTLTMGDGLKITNYAIYPDATMKLFALQVTKDLEVGSNHPLAIAVRTFVEEYAVDKFKLKLGRVKVPEVEEIAGKGLIGDIILGDQVDDHLEWGKYRPTKVLLGNGTLMDENKTQFTSHQHKILNEWKVQGKSVVIVSIQCEEFFRTKNFIPILLMAARDEVRPEAKSVITNLRNNGIETWMISGDNFTTANSVAKELGIDNIIAEVLPEEKAEKISWLKKTHPNRPVTIAMVGDGINDAPALATADVGIALATGSDLALTSSDFVLLSKNFPLISLLTLFKLSRKVFQRVRFNFGWAIVYNMIGIPIASGVIYPYRNSRLSPVWASAAMAASSVSVVLSSLALKLFKRPKVVVEESTRLRDYEPILESFN